MSLGAKISEFVGTNVRRVKFASLFALVGIAADEVFIPGNAGYDLLSGCKTTHASRSATTVCPHGAWWDQSDKPHP